MELVLKKDVENLGFKDDVVVVKNGYGRNYLIPKGFAVLATDSAKKVLAENLKQRAFKEAKLVEEAKEKSTKIEAMDLKISAKVAQKDKLFGSVSNEEVSQAISKQGVSLNAKCIKVPGKNIKRIGKYTADVRLHRTIIARVSFEIVPEKAS